jgi:hypothetical protein
MANRLAQEDSQEEVGYSVYKHHCKSCINYPFMNSLYTKSQNKEGKRTTYAKSRPGEEQFAKPVKHKGGGNACGRDILNMGSCAMFNCRKSDSC